MFAERILGLWRILLRHPYIAPEICFSVILAAKELALRHLTILLRDSRIHGIYSLVLVFLRYWLKPKIANEILHIDGDIQTRLMCKLVKQL